MPDSSIDIIDVIYPHAGIHPVLRQVRDGKVRVFLISEIDKDGMPIKCENVPAQLCEVFENNA